MLEQKQEGGILVLVATIVSEVGLEIVAGVQEIEQVVAMEQRLLDPALQLAIVVVNNSS